MYTGYYFGIMKMVCKYIEMMMMLKNIVNVLNAIEVFNFT